MKRLSAKVLVVPMLLGVFCVSPSHAATTTWNGSVTLQKPPSYPDHETVRYFSEGCRGDHADATFNAFIDVSAYQGKTLRFTPGANPPLWRLIKDAPCSVTVLGTLMSTTSAMEWVSTGSFLSISYSADSIVGPVEGYTYALQVCPCDA